MTHDIIDFSVSTLVVGFLAWAFLPSWGYIRSWRKRDAKDRAKETGLNVKVTFEPTKPEVSNFFKWLEKAPVSEIRQVRASLRYVPPVVSLASLELSSMVVEHNLDKEIDKRAPKTNSWDHLEDE